MYAFRENVVHYALRMYLYMIHKGADSNIMDMGKLNEMARETVSSQASHFILLAYTGSKLT